ncbi:MAG: hypothetical protein WBC53_07280, partial [Phycisphaerae bacterium]
MTPSTTTSEQLGVHSTVIPLNPRNRGRNGLKTRYRREMKREFPRQQNGQRWQAESNFSRHKPAGGGQASPGL